VKKIKLFIFGFLAIFVFEHCQPKTNGDGSSQTPTTPAAELGPATKFDSIVQQLKGFGTLTKADMNELNIIDTSYSYDSSATIYCDTTIQLNDSIFYSIIFLPDQYGVCSYNFIVTIDEKNKRAIASQYLNADCDIDFSAGVYDLYEHKIVASDIVHLTKTTIFQKKDKTSGNEQENIDHSKEQISFFRISQAGKISFVEL
jgi:hypothetical protein